MLLLRWISFDVFFSVPGSFSVFSFNSQTIFSCCFSISFVNMIICHLHWDLMGSLNFAYRCTPLKMICRVFESCFLAVLWGSLYFLINQRNLKFLILMMNISFFALSTHQIELMSIGKSLFFLLVFHPCFCFNLTLDWLKIQIDILFQLVTFCSAVYFFIFII